MKNRLIVKLDGLNRVNVPNELLELAEVKNQKKVAFCQTQDGLALKRMDDVHDYKVLGIGIMDEKNRFTIPKYLREDTTEFEVFIFNEELVIKEVD